MKILLRSRCGFTLLEIMIVVVTIALLLAIAIPAFQKIHTASQDKAVLNNMRQFATAADQYYLENGVTLAAQTDLMGTYVKSFKTVASEFYPDQFTQGVTITVTNIGGSRVLTFAP
jgi:type IV pilus assembly protein PilA